MQLAHLISLLSTVKSDSLSDVCARICQSNSDCLLGCTVSGSNNHTSTGNNHTSIKEVNQTHPRGNSSHQGDEIDAVGLGQPNSRNGSNDGLDIRDRKKSDGGAKFGPILDDSSSVLSQLSLVWVAVAFILI